jgi:hypothetical protein
MRAKAARIAQDLSVMPSMDYAIREIERLAV